MDWYRQQVVPRMVDRVCGAAGYDRWRRATTAGLSGTVVEIGFGSGRNIALYPNQIERVYAVEPSDVGRRLAAGRMAASAVRIDQTGLNGESLPLDDDSCDGALCTFTLCTIPDVERALAELVRVVRPGGRFHFLEHGAAPDPSIQRWQHRIEPVQKRLADGCHLTRDPLALVEAAGFRIEDAEQRYVKGPKPWSYFTRAHAILPA